MWKKILIFTFDSSCFQYSLLKIQKAVIIYLHKNGSHKHFLPKNNTFLKIYIYSIKIFFLTENYSVSFFLLKNIALFNLRFFFFKLST